MKKKSPKKNKDLVSAIDAPSSSKSARTWTTKDITTLRKIMKAAPSVSAGYKEAHKILGRTEVSLQIKWCRLNREAKKKATHSKKSTDSKFNPNNITPNILTFDIKDVQVDLKNKKLTIIY